MPNFERIFIKKDRHQPTSKEWNRLKIREREEKAKPENNGVNIQLDMKQRTLKRNGQIIDRFNPVF